MSPKKKPVPALSDLVEAYVFEQCTAILDAEPQLRARDSDVVHPTRVGIRRLRSTVRVFGELFDLARAGDLEHELVWWAGLLGAVRDLDVLDERLHTALAGLPPELVLGPISADLSVELQVRRQVGWDAIVPALDSDRYRRLAADLRRWRSETPFTEAASVPQTKVKRYVKRADAKLRRRLDRAIEAHRAGEPTATELMHRARKAGKRHRYAVELALPVLGDKGQSLVDARKDLQDVLGDHQDSVVAAELLRSEGARVGSRSGRNAFTYGLLYGQEQAKQADLESRLAGLATRI